RDVRWHEVRGELDPGEVEVGGLGEGAHQACLAQAGHALDEHVAARQGGDEQLLDHRVLAEDHAADGVAQPPELLPEALGGALGYVVTSHHAVLVSPRAPAPPRPVSSRWSVSRQYTDGARCRL